MLYKVFLDTNIYIASNYDFHNFVFTELLKLAKEKRVQLHINYVVYNEVLQHLRDDITEAIQKLNKDCKNKKLSLFNKFTNFTSALTMPELDLWLQTAIDCFKKYLNDCNQKMLSDNNINIEEILSDYFSRPPKAPFQKSKMEEFKDAITVNTIIREIHNLDTDETYCIISNDKGFRKAIEDKITSKHQIFIFESLQNFIELVNKNLNQQKQTCNKIEKLLSTDWEKKTIIDYIKEQINIAELELDTPTHELLSLNKINEKDIKYKCNVLKIENKIEKVILATINLNVSCVLKVLYKYIDKEFSFWDKEECGYVIKDIRKHINSYNTNFDIIIVLCFNSYEEISERAKFIVYDEFNSPLYIKLECENIIDSEDISNNSYEIF